MTSALLERLRRLGEPLVEDVSRAHWLAAAGHTKTMALVEIYERHAAATSRESLETAIEAFRDAPEGTAQARSASALLDWQVDSHTSREIARSEELEVAWANAAVVRLSDGREVPYERVAIEISNTADREQRNALEDARAELVGRELAPLRRDRIVKEHDMLRALDVAPSYVDAIERMGGLPVRALAVQCEAFLRDTQGMWDEILRERLRRELGITPSQARRADGLALMRARGFDRYFPASELEPTVRRQIAEMGLDPEASGRIVIDTAERAGKRARAFCAPVRVPDEIYLVVRPSGGVTDWVTLLHEFGHALHFANADPELPFEHRWLGDNSVTEGYAMLLDHRVQDRRWLQRYTTLTGEDLGRYLRAAGFEELRFLRRYCAKLLYELELHDEDARLDEMPALYAERLTAATGFRYPEEDAFVDVDPRFYAGRYLQAWQLQSVLAEALTERFDEDWWRNPRAGPWIVQELLSAGQRERAAELATRVARRELSFAPLVRAVERLLVA